MKFFRKLLCVVGIICVSSCSVVNVVGKTAVNTGKVVGKTVKTTSKVVAVTGKVVAKSAKGLKTVIQIPGGKRVIKLAKRGNSLFVDALINRKVKVRLLVDTGCTDTQISSSVARRLGLPLEESERVLCRIAGGKVVSGRALNIKEIRIGRIKVRNVRAIILDNDSTQREDGLLGMSFLNNFIFKIDSEKGELTLQRRK